MQSRRTQKLDMVYVNIRHFKIYVYYIGFGLKFMKNINIKQVTLGIDRKSSIPEMSLSHCKSRSGEGTADENKSGSILLISGVLAFPIR